MGKRVRPVPRSAAARLTHHFAPLRRVVVPVVHGSDGAAALAAARALAREVVLVGLVRIAPEEPLSAGAAAARGVRRLLRALAPPGQSGLRAKARVRVSRAPWADLLTVLASEQPDLLLLEWDGHFAALGVSVSEVLAHPPCDVALVRGPFPPAPGRVLVPMRGGPHAELALRVGLSLRPSELTALHLTRAGSAESDAPF